MGGGVVHYFAVITADKQHDTGCRETKSLINRRVNEKWCSHASKKKNRGCVQNHNLFFLLHAILSCPIIYCKASSYDPNAKYKTNK